MVWCSSAVLVLLCAADGSLSSAAPSPLSWRWSESFVAPPQDNPNVDARSVSEVVLAAGGGCVHSFPFLIYSIPIPDYYYVV